MKRLTLLLTLAALTVLLSGCGVAGSGTSTQNTDKSTTTTTTQEADTTQICAGVIVAGACNVIQDSGSSGGWQSLALGLGSICANGWLMLVICLLVCLGISLSNRG